MTLIEPPPEPLSVRSTRGSASHLVSQLPNRWVHEILCEPRPHVSDYPAAWTWLVGYPND